MMKTLILIMMTILLIACEETVVTSQSTVADKEIEQPQALEFKPESSTDKTDLREIGKTCGEDLDPAERYLFGEVKLVITDKLRHDSHDEEFYFKTDKGDILALKSDQRAHQLELNQPGVYKVRETNSTYSVVSSMSKSLHHENCFRDNVMQARLAPKYMLLKDKRIALVYPGEEFRELPQSNMAQNLETFYANFGKGDWSVDVRVFEIDFGRPIGGCNDNQLGCLSTFGGIAREQLLQNGVDNVEYLALVLVQNGMGVGGFAEVGGLVSINYSNNMGVIGHELGHNFGLHHAGSLDIDSGMFDPYGDYTSIMGRNVTRLPNAAQYEYLNLIDPNRVKNVTETSQHFISAPEFAGESLFPGVKQILKIRNGSSDYVISTRANNNDVPWGMGGPMANKVFVHAVAGNQTTRLAVLDSGESLEYLGFKVEFLDRVDQVFRVNIYTNAQDQAPVDRSYPNAPQLSCLGQIPGNASLCIGDDENLNQSIPRILTSNCTAARKCEYICNEGYSLSDDGSTCLLDDPDSVIINYECTGTPAANSVLCPMDDQNLTDFVEYTLQGSCTEDNKCQRICAEGYELQITAFSRSCVPTQAPTPNVEINISRTDYQGTPHDSFRMGVHQMFYQVSHAGANAKGCIQHWLDEGGSNWGYCENLPDSSDRWFPMDQSGEWFFTGNSWRLYHDLRQPHIYYRPGLYRMFWFNPDTGMRDSFEFTIEAL